MSFDRGVLDLIEVAANLFGSVDAVIKVGDEAGDGSLEVDVVLPERVVGVDEQGLVRGIAEGLIWSEGSGLIRSSHEVDYKGRVLRRYGGHATVGGCLTRMGCDRL